MSWRSQHFPAPDVTTVRDEHDEYLHTHGLDGAVENEQACRVGGACSFSAVPDRRPEGDSSSPGGAGPVSAPPTLPELLGAWCAHTRAHTLDELSAVGEHGLRRDLLRVVSGIERTLQR